MMQLLYRRMCCWLAAAFVGTSLGVLVTLAWDRIDRTLTTLERATSATEKAAAELEETARAARKAFISDK